MIIKFMFIKSSDDLALMIDEDWKNPQKGAKPASPSQSGCRIALANGDWWAYLYLRETQLEGLSGFWSIS